jgi:hypothetical protein
MFEDKNTILRCLDKSTVVYYDGHSILVADDSVIYYFGSLIPTTKKFYRFYKLVKSDMIGKILYSKDDVPYLDRMKYIKNSKTNDKKEYIWLG